MDLQQLINNITPEIYQRLVSAVELGKWANGVPLTREQKEHTLQLVMLWQMRHNTSREHMTIDQDGEIIIKSKQQFKQEFGIDQAFPRADAPASETTASSQPDKADEVSFYTPIATLKPQ